MEKRMKNKQKIRKEVQIFRESVRKVVVMLSGKDIPVAERGSRAYVEYNKDGTPCMVNLPSLPDDATDGLMNAIRGFLDHEVAHLLFTDSKLAFKLLEKKDSPAFHLWNAVEDTFIERRMGEVFSGSKRNLVNTQRHVIDKLFVPKVDDALRALSRNPRDLFLKFLLMPALRAWAGQTPFLEFMEPYWAYVSDPVSKLTKAGVPAAVPLLMSTEDCIKLAGRISLALKEEMEKPEGKSGSGDSEENDKENDSPDDIGSELPTKSNDESVSDKQGSEEETQEEEEPSPVNNSNEDNIKDKEEGSEANSDFSNANDSQPEDGDDEPDQSQGFGGFEGDPDDNDSDGEHPENGSVADDADSTSSPVDQQSSPGDSDTGGSQEATQGDLSEEEGAKGDIPLDAAFKALEGTEVAPEQGMEEALNEVMANELKGVPKGSYRPYQRSYDYIGPIDDAENHLRKTHKAFGRIHLNRGLKNWRIDDEGTKLFASNVEHRLADGSASTLAKDLERAIASRNKVQFIPGQRRGKVHSANLYRLSMNDDRVFRRKEDHKAVNACVQQVLDLSGSMQGSKVWLALACAYTISDALDRINVPNIITGFTTAGCDVDAARKMGRGYNRYESLMLPTVKGWHERANTPTTRKRLGCLSERFPLEDNVDGESIMALAQHFAGRTEDKKIMLVMSDGAPAGIGHDFSDHLKAVAESIEGSGLIELMGIGILTDAPSRFYKNHVEVKKVEDLGATVVRKLSQLILG
ncbi:TPA: porphyrin biosynthesis protein [Enterobacter cloacae]